MRIGVDGSCWANGRGYGRFTRELLSAMQGLAPDDEFVFFLDPLAESRFDLSGPNIRRVLVSQSAAPTEAAAADGNRSPFDMLRLTRAVRREKPDVFFSPSVYTYFPLPPRTRAVVTIHDAIAERFPELTLPSPRARLFWKAKIRLAIWQARLILTVSEFAAREIEEMLNVSRHRMRIAVEAPSPEYRPSDSAAEIEDAAQRVGLPRGARWFTYVGGFSPHKYVDRIVRAHAAIAAEEGDAAPYLLLVGAVSGDAFLGDHARIHEAIAQGGTEHLVKWTGFVSDQELRHLHSGAQALLLPSASEGFGLPAVEAAACATPVIATTASPLPQLLEGGGIFVPPGDERAITEAMRAVMTDEVRRVAMGKGAMEAASRLTWQRSARSALDAMYEAAA